MLILKYTDFNILVFEISIKGYFESRPPLWQQNHHLKSSSSYDSFRFVT